MRTTQAYSQQYVEEAEREKPRRARESGDGVGIHGSFGLRVKYCYDISKVAFGISVLNPAIGLSRGLAEIVIGLVLAALFLGLALHLERGSPP